MKKELKKLDGYMKGIVYAVLEKAWMDETGMLDWTEHVWKPYVLWQCGIHLLIMDEFKVHMVGRIVHVSLPSLIRIQVRAGSTPSLV